ncbi:TPA: pseudaminic acid synthase [Aeromonas veronii]
MTQTMTRPFNPERCFIIAELSANHGHSLETALATVRAAKACGADAIKIQTYTADTITLDCDNEHFQINQDTIWDGTTLYKLYQEAYTPWEWHAAIQAEAHNAGLIFFSTPFDPSAVDFLETLDVPIYKIASFEITDIPLIEYTASKGKPMIISTGIATLADIDAAVQACHRMGNHDITLLKCTSSYPAPVEEANLLTIPNLAQTFGVKAGLSDHTLGHVVAIAAVALGATVIEKHFIIDRALGGPDASFSLTPNEFKLMVEGVRQAEAALGSVSYTMTKKTIASRKFARSLFVCCDIKAGEILTTKNVRSVRPNDGLPPIELPNVLGRKAKKHIPLGTPLSWDLLI